MRRVLPVGVAVLAALAIAAALLAVTGVNPAEAGRQLVLGAFGDRYHASETVVRAIPIGLVALGLLPAMRAGVFSVGSEGQLAAGALTSTVLALHLPAAMPVHLVAGALAGAAGGALWALVPALLRAYARVNEILSTLLLNYVAGFGLLWLLRTTLDGPGGAATPRSEALPASARIPKLLDGTRLHWGVLAVVLAAVVLAWWVRTPHGFAIDVYGARPKLAARLGVRPARTVVSTMLIAGAAAGLAGWMQVAGVQGRLYPSVAGGLGFTGVLVALLGGLRPGGVLAAALLLGALATGSEGLQANADVPVSLATVLEALLLGGVALAAAARFRWLRRLDER